MSSPGVRLALRLFAGLVSHFIATGALAAPERRVAASEYSAKDPRQLADDVAAIARRCWAREPAFAGFMFDKIEQGAEPTTFRILFRAKGQKPTAGRSLRMLTGKSGSLVMLVVEQEGVDVLGPVRRDGAALIRGQATAC